MTTMGDVGEPRHRELVIRCRSAVGRVSNGRVGSIFTYQRVRTRAVGPATDGVASARKHAQLEIYRP